MQADKKERGCFPVGWAIGQSPRWGREVAGLGSGVVVFNFIKRLNPP